MNKKICLFTAHSPLRGGGSVILHSLIKYLPEISFSWNYIAKTKSIGYEDGYLKCSFMGSSVVNDVFQSWKMLTDLPSSFINEIVNKLLVVNCDSYWIISHNEGLRIALELCRIQKKRPVHLTIHDDWAGALSARSKRYRFFASSAINLTIKTLNEVGSFDVISKGMQDYYQKISGRRGEICHRYLPRNSINNLTIGNLSSTEINAGHIGSVYDTKDFFRFLYLLKSFAKFKGLIPAMHMWGSHINLKEIPKDLNNLLHLHPELAEEEVIPMLSQTSFVYSMYPMSEKMIIFSKTSLPTKLTSYVQCGRPIFAQGPADSTLSEFINTTGTGVLWSSYDEKEGMAMLEKLFCLSLTKEVWERARKEYFGEENLAVMSNYLLKNLYP